MVALPLIIFKPMTMLQKMAKIMEYSHLLNLADECDDPHMKMVYACTWALLGYPAYQRTWRPFNPILGETYEMVNHNGVRFLTEQQYRQQQVSWFSPNEVPISSLQDWRKPTEPECPTSPTTPTRHPSSYSEDSIRINEFKSCIIIPYFCSYKFEYFLMYKSHRILSRK